MSTHLICIVVTDLVLHSFSFLQDPFTLLAAAGPDGGDAVYSLWLVAKLQGSCERDGFNGMRKSVALEGFPGKNCQWQGWRKEM